MASKGALKSIKAYIDKQEYQKAIEVAQDLVKQDSSNQTAFLFLGFAFEKVGNFEGAEKALSSATGLKVSDPQPYKGLITLFEKQGRLKIDQYHQIVHHLAKIYADQDDRDQCQNVIDKYEMFAKKHGSQAQYRQALEHILPTSDLYDTLEGRVLKPELAYQRLLESAQSEETEWVKTQIEERRTRLGAKIDQITREVKREAISLFRVEDRYETLIHWTHDDDFRHELEQQYFELMFENLTALPEEQKPIQRDKLLNIANGMVIIKQKFAPAWKVALEWVDAEELGDWDVNILREYVGYFPDDGLSKVLRGFLDSGASPFPLVEQEGGEEDDSVEAKLSEAEQLILMNEGLDDCPDSQLGHRIMAHTFLHLEEYHSAAELARKARKLHLSSEQKFALSLRNSIDDVDLILANALIYYQSPRHHAESKLLFEEILGRKPLLTSALLGVGLIYEEDEDYVDAATFLRRASERDGTNVRIRLELAWCEALSNDLKRGLEELQHILLELDAQDPINLNMKAETLYRIAYCKWHINTTTAARKDKTGPYKDLIDSVKASSTYAPAYTLLGIYFLDYGKSKPRARVALQKAFELSTSELKAAERLARLFADGAEWDLVELVAQRVISSGKAKPAPGSKKLALSWPYSALGVVQMNKQQYSQAIISFQSALRIHPDDYHSWVGLGESYHNSGRYIAASKAFEKGESIEHGMRPEHTWFAKYMLANVQKEMGEFDKAIEQYELVLKIKSGEFGVLVALLQTMSESAWSKIAHGMFGEAAQLANRAIVIALEIAEQRVEAFNMWKAIGDACSALAHVKTFARESDIETVIQLLQTKTTGSEFDLLAEQDKASVDILKQEAADQATSASDKYLIASILAHKRAIHASSHDSHARAVSWYNLGWAEHQTYCSAGANLQIKGQKPRRFLKAAMKSFKQAIELEASNSEFWNALGVVTMVMNPNVGQHSFIRSLHLNDHSARTWTNLGALYLVNNDTQLANQAFTRAQSADPEYADAWIGQGLLATLHGQPKEAKSLFMHAFEISNAGSLPAKRHYALSVFDHLLQTAEASKNIAQLLGPLFAARQIHALSPADIIATHLTALYAERAGDYEGAYSALAQVSDAIEEEFEKAESDENLIHFAQTKADMARVQLGNENFAAAVENAQTALDLTDEGLEPVYIDLRNKIRLSAHITAGLAQSHLKTIDQSIKMFQAALEESNHNPDVVCMLAQVLWAKGGQGEQEAAQSQLFDCISKHPRHVQSICLLATIGLLGNDPDILDAVVEDLQALLTTDSTTVHEKLKVTTVLSSIKACSTTDMDRGLDGMKLEAMSNIMLSPSQPQGWSQMARVAEDIYAADMAKANAMRQIPPNGYLEADDIAEAFVNTGLKEDVDQAKMLAPWKVVVYDGKIEPEEDGLPLR